MLSLLELIGLISDLRGLADVPRKLLGLEPVDVYVQAIAASLEPERMRLADNGVMLELDEQAFRNELRARGVDLFTLPVAPEPLTTAIGARATEALLAEGVLLGVRPGDGIEWGWAARMVAAAHQAYARSLFQSLDAKAMRLSLHNIERKVDGVPAQAGHLAAIQAQLTAIQAALTPRPADGPAATAAPSANPFFTGGRINDPKQFLGRERLVREMRTELTKRNSVSLVGESQMGKSSLVYLLYLTRAEWLLPEARIEYLDLARVLGEADFCETVLGRLGLTGNSLRDLRRALETRDLILLLDEVERLTDPDFSPRLHDLLRSLGQEPHFAMVLATQRPLEDVFPARQAGGVSPFHNIFTRKMLGPFTEAEARALLARAGDLLSVQDLTDLLAVSRCPGGHHPARLQAAARQLWDNRTAGKD